MKKDNLEKFVQGNKDKFYDLSPSGKVWHGIEKGIHSKLEHRWLWKAAAVFFFCLSSFLIFDKYSPSTRQDVLVQKQEVAKDFGDIEKFYFQIISDKRELIYEYDHLEAPIKVDFEQDLQKLDAMYEVLKEELKNNPSKKVVDALILNLLVRIDVLNEKIEELEGVENGQEEMKTDPAV